MEQPPSNNPSLPLARVIPVQELTGRLSKQVTVPPGRTGVVIEASGQARTLAAGLHRVASIWQRLVGSSAGMRIGYVTQGQLLANVRSNHLLSGDDVLMDAGLFAALQIQDPIRFFSEYVVPRGEIRGSVLDLDEAAGRAVLGGVVRCYQAADLIADLPTRRLVEEIRPGLEAVLSNQGLSLLQLQLLSFSKSDERARIAEQVQALEERLQSVELGRKMAVEEQRIAYEDFIRQIQAETGPTLGLRPVETERPAHKLPIEVIRGWAKAQKEAGGTRSWQNLWGLWQSKPAAGSETRAVRRPPRRWWLPSVLWVGFLLLCGYTATRLTMLLEGRISAEMFWTLIMAIWSIVVPVAFESIRKMIIKREEIAQATWMLPGATRLDELVRKDRPRADRLVREQCRDELGRALGALETLITRIHQGGQIDLAVQLRRLKQSFEAAQDDLQQPSFGAPAYLSDLHLSAMAWNRMLDYDEDLLVAANVLSEKVRSLQQQVGQGVFDPEHIAEIQRSLDDLIFRFGGRSLALQNLASQKIDL